jgi:signal transduction histidine kinase
MRLPAARSLLGQFVALHLIVALATAMALFWSASALLHQTADHFQRNLLRRQAALSIIAAGASTTAAQPIVLSNGMAVSTIGPDRHVRRSEGPPRPEILAAAPLDRTSHFFRRGGVEGYSVPAGDGWIVVSQDDADPAVVTDDIVRTFLPRFALIGLPIAALAPFIGVLLARRLTLRMRAVSAIAGTIGPRSLDTRLPLGHLPLEAEPLAEATNAALDRLAAAIHVQTAFAADVAHELRTPLAVIRLRADAVAEPDTRAAIMAAVDRAARVISQLLSLAELERPLEDGGTPLDLHALAEHVVADRAPAVLASGRSIALKREGETAWVRGYPDALMLALENLVDNAARHTSPGTAIIVKSGPGGQIMVSDDGDPILDTHFARLTNRLWQGSSTSSEGTGIEGSGIGLSIVERVARAHGGSLAVSRGQRRRGLAFLITLDDARHSPVSNA